MKAALTAIAVCSGLICLGGCRSSGEPLDLLNLTMSERASDVLDPENDRWRLGTDTVLNPGTLNFKMLSTSRFLIAGIALPDSGQNGGFDGPNVTFMLYSADVMRDLSQRISSGVGGGSFSTISMPADGDLSERIAATNAIDRLIGVSVSYYGENPFWPEVRSAVTARLGSGKAIPGHEGAMSWHVEDRYVLLIPEYELFSVFAADQVSNGCLIIGGAGVLDLDNCDLDEFSAGYPDNIRIGPTQQAE